MNKFPSSTSVALTSEGLKFKLACAPAIAVDGSMTWSDVLSLATWSVGRLLIFYTFSDGSLYFSK